MVRAGMVRVREWGCGWHGSAAEAGRAWSGRPDPWPPSRAATHMALPMTSCTSDPMMATSAMIHSRRAAGRGYSDLGPCVRERAGT